MDIDYLLVLQSFREGIGACLTEFLSKMTWFGEMNTCLILIGLIYWCVSKEIGNYLLMGWSANRIVNGALKVTACVYRPWIRDARIVPDPKALETATGYSFPSGHSMNAASLFGGMAIRRDMKGKMRALMWTTLLLVAFSRNFLGVHTPQDVIVGAGAGVLVMYLTGRLLLWLESHQDKDILVAVAGIAIALLTALYAVTKPYPADYVNGELLVDGLKMANDTLKAVGWMMAYMLGWLLERRYVSFTTQVSMQDRFLRLTSGLLGYYLVTLVVNPLIKAALAGFAGAVVTCFMQMFYIVLLFPLLITKLESQSKDEID